MYIACLGRKSSWYSLCFACDEHDLEANEMNKPIDNNQPRIKTLQTTESTSSEENKTNEAEQKPKPAQSPFTSTDTMTQTKEQPMDQWLRPPAKEKADVLEGKLAEGTRDQLFLKRDPAELTARLKQMDPLNRPTAESASDSPHAGRINPDPASKASIAEQLGRELPADGQGTPSSARPLKNRGAQDFLQQGIANTTAYGEKLKSGPPSSAWSPSSDPYAKHLREKAKDARAKEAEARAKSDEHDKRADGSEKLASQHREAGDNLAAEAEMRNARNEKREAKRAKELADYHKGQAEKLEEDAKKYDTTPERPREDGAVETEEAKKFIEMVGVRRESGKGDVDPVPEPGQEGPVPMDEELGPIERDGVSPILVNPDAVDQNIDTDQIKTFEAVTDFEAAGGTTGTPPDDDD